jgi:Winged helix DNA-binding domain
MTGAALRRRRAAAQLLDGDVLAPAGAVRHLLGVQAQDLRAARLALRARGAAVTAAEVDAALSANSSLVAGWLMRGTLHLVAREDYGWLHGLTAPLSAATCRRRLAQLGAEDATPAIARMLAAEGPLARGAIGERLTAAGIRTEGQVLPHLLALAAASGGVVLGPVRGGTQRFALARDWLGPADAPVERDAALAELARRYLRGHGPAADADLAAWSGLPLRDARAGLAAIARELVEARGLLDLAARAAEPRPLPARLLPAFDPYLLGWRDRSFAVAGERAQAVHPGGGILRATAVVAGRVVGTWSRRRGRVEIAPFGALPARAAGALGREAEAVRRFEG